MSAGAVRRSVAGMALAAALAGCFEARGRLHYIGDEKLSYYKDVATEIDYPHLCVPPSDAAIATEAPRRIRHPRKDELWDLTLAEALHLALANNPILRTRGTFLQPGSVLFSNPDLVNSVFDPAIQETGVVFGQRGVEAALSDFDTNFTTSMLWGRNEQVQNNAFEAGGLQPGQTLEEDTANFRARLEKLFAYGGTFGVTNEINYSWNNTPARLFPSVYTGFLRADYRQPLLAGGGLFFNRVAGPDARNPGGIIGVNQGVVIARINTDISIADFEASVRNMLKDVEDLYWELYLAYRTYDAETYARDSALRTWEVVRIRLDIGVGRGDAQARGGAADEAQARDNYFEARARAETALADLYNTETQLRRLIGLPVNDGKVIRPVTEPVVAEYLPDWHLALAEALTRRVELRRQKWNIKSLDLQL
ncbi:MAG: TolC family protein, partial [Planctomycetaceae bacterium]